MHVRETARQSLISGASFGSIYVTIIYNQLGKKKKITRKPLLTLLKGM